MNVSGNLDLIFTLTLTTNDVGAGYYFDMVFGNTTLDSPDRRAITTGTASSTTPTTRFGKDRSG